MFGMGKPPAKSAPAAKHPKRERKDWVDVSVKLEPHQRDKFALLGGDAWLREQIERAKVPAAGSPSPARS